MKKKDCKECIKNNRKPNAIACLECSKCKKQHTNDCPNSSECYSKKDKPYFEKVVEE